MFTCIMLHASSCSIVHACMIQNMQFNLSITSVAAYKTTYITSIMQCNRIIIYVFVIIKNVHVCACTVTHVCTIAWIMVDACNGLVCVYTSRMPCMRTRIYLYEYCLGALGRQGGHLGPALDASWLICRLFLFPLERSDLAA